MDLADVVESLRGVLRSLCTGVVRLPIEDAYGEDVADVARLRRLSASLGERAKTMEPEAREEAERGARELGEIAARLAANPKRPSTENMCERYAEGEIDARTVLFITGWSLDRLHDECEKLPVAPDY